MLLLLILLRFRMNLEKYFIVVGGVVKQPFVDLLLFHSNCCCSAY
jgi:hypothetical protein